MYMDKDLMEDELHTLINQFNGKKMIIEIFILYYSLTYIHFMMEMKIN